MVVVDAAFLVAFLLGEEPAAYTSAELPKRIAPTSANVMIVLVIFLIGNIVNDRLIMRKGLSTFCG